MNIFISWSGDKSKLVAHLLQKWIKRVIQASNPWVSTNMDSGASWSLEIDKKLTSNFGIVCLTEENKNKPWILFEAGALAKGLESSRVCTFLIDDIEIKQPLERFQHTKPDEEGMLRLIRTINNHVENKLPDPVLLDVFEINWPSFKISYDRILQESLKEVPYTQKAVPDMIEDVLTTIKSFDKRLYDLEARQVDNISLFKEILIKTYEHQNDLWKFNEKFFWDKNTPHRRQLCSTAQRDAKRLFNEGRDLSYISQVLVNAHRLTQDEHDEIMKELEA